MPSRAPQIPAERIEGFAKDRWERSRHEFALSFDQLNETDRSQLIREAREDAQEAYPHLLAAFKENERLERVGELVEDRAAVRARHFEEFREQLLSDEAVMRVAVMLAEDDAAYLSQYEAHLEKHGRADEGYRAQARRFLEAALASLDRDGGTT